LCQVCTASVKNKIEVPHMQLCLLSFACNW
jgi:hypothetical protein